MVQQDGRPSTQVGLLVTCIYMTCIYISYLRSNYKRDKAPERAPTAWPWPGKLGSTGGRLVSSLGVSVPSVPRCTMLLGTLGTRGSAHLGCTVRFWYICTILYHIHPYAPISTHIHPYPPISTHINPYQVVFIKCKQLDNIGLSRLTTCV